MKKIYIVKSCKTINNTNYFEILFQNNDHKFLITKSTLSNCTNILKPTDLIGASFSFNINECTPNNSHGKGKLEIIDISIERSNPYTNIKDYSKRDWKQRLKSNNILQKINKKTKITGQIDAKFKTILNNLLLIKTRGDNAVFSYSNCFDLSTILSPSNYEKIFSEKNHKLQIIDDANHRMILQLKRTKTFDEIENVFLAHDTYIPQKFLKSNIIKNFDKLKEAIIEHIRKDKNRFVKEWRKFKNKYEDLQSQINSWPLFIGTLFMKIKTNKSVMYAPLLYKKCEIQINRKGEIYLKTQDDIVELNEKLLFLLEQEDIMQFSKINKNYTHSFQKYIDTIMIRQNSKIKPIDIFGKWEKIKKDNVINTEIEYAKGAVLTLANPFGGALRSKMVDLIKSNEISNIMNIDDSKNDNEIIKKEFNIKSGIYRITKTDMSQELAIFGALKNSSIIWGPPGTGKSQTLANIIGNILAQNKSAIITSEKKAALDVLRNKLGILNKYIFYGLFDKNVNKKLLYEPIQNLIKKLEQYKTTSTDRNLIYPPTSYINNKEWKYIEENMTILDNENIESLIKINQIMQQNNMGVAYAVSTFSIIHKNKIWLEKLFEIGIKNISKLHNHLNIKKKILPSNERGFQWELPQEFKQFEKAIESIFNRVGNPNDLLHCILKIQNINNITYLENSKKYEKTIENIVSNYSSDIHHIDNMAFQMMKQKIDWINKHARLKKKWDLFVHQAKLGIRLPHKFINIHYDIIKVIFPIIISTPASLSSIIDLDKSKFDYAIFDEASQLHIEKAIPYISIAKIAIIAGDSKQMQPTDFFQIRDRSDDKNNIANSLLTYAYTKGLKEKHEYLLNKNYRSHYSDLMLFSSLNFYDMKLDVIDGFKNDDPSPIEVFNINGQWNNSININEIEKIIELANKYIDMYDSIILLTFNVKQQNYLQNYIFYNNERTILNALQKEKIKLRNIENIQGDEADLIIISIGYDSTTMLQQTYVARKGGANALNVAISRAKDKMIILKSISASDITLTEKSSKSLINFKEWLQYLEANAFQRKKWFIENKKNTLSWQKKETLKKHHFNDVLNTLKNEIKLSKKYIFLTNFPIGSYTIDIVIVNKKNNKINLCIDIIEHMGISRLDDYFEEKARQYFLAFKGYPLIQVHEIIWGIEQNIILEKIQKQVNRFP